MADAKISELTEKTAPLIDDDLFVIVDSDGTATTKKMTKRTALNSVTVSAKKSTAGTINVGEVVYIAGFDSGDELITVELADNSASATMPAYGICKTTITSTTAGVLAIGGEVRDIDTSGYSVGDSVYVGTSGALTSTKPVGTAAIQKFGVVSRVDLSLGVITIFGAGRSNDVPNIPSNEFWLGNGSGVATATNFDTEVSANVDVSANTTHRSSDGKDHSDVVLNNTHRSSDGKDHSDVVLNNTHRSSDGKDHSDVVLNNTHRAATGNPHSADTDDISEGTVNKYAKVGWLSYSNNTAYSSVAGPQIIDLSNDQDSNANGYFTKTNATTFRADFTGFAEVNYNVGFYLGDNGRSIFVEVLKNGSPVATLSRYQSGQNVNTRKGSCALTMPIDVATNDTFQIRFTESGGTDVSIDANEANFYLKRLT